MKKTEFYTRMRTPDGIKAVKETGYWCHVMQPTEYGYVSTVLYFYKSASNWWAIDPCTGLPLLRAGTRKDAVKKAAELLDVLNRYHEHHPELIAQWDYLMQGGILK